MKAAVVGAGIMGSLLALGLHRQGWQVTVFDEHSLAHDAANCSNAAAGLLAPISELDKADPIIHRLGVESLTHCWPDILQQLACPIYFRNKGCLVLHHPRDAAEWQQFKLRISKHLGDGFYQSLHQQQLQELEPQLTQFTHAYYIADEAHIDSQTTLKALGQHLRVQGVHWQESTKVSKLLPGYVVVNGSEHEFDMVFDCRGLGAKTAAPDLRGIRGELIWLHAPEVEIQRPVRFLHPRYSLYLVPRADHQYIIGSSELEAEDYSPISVRTNLELLSAAYTLHAGFAEARIIKTVTHCRPCFPDHKPRIRHWGKLILINGLYRHGYLIAPALAEEILRGLKGQQYLNYPELWEDYSAQYLRQQSTETS